MVSSSSSALAGIGGGFAALCTLSWLWTTLRAPGFHVKGKHVLITGGSSGLGLELAKIYASQGALVSILARDARKLNAAKQAIEAAAAATSHRVFTCVCDVTDYVATQRAVDAANAFHGRVTDHVVCNAGVAQPGFLLDQEPEVFRRLMDTNYFGTLHTIKAALPAMVATGDDSDGGDMRRVILVSSAAALTTFVGYTQYSSSKYATRGLAESLRNELQLYGIATSIYYPGNIATPMFMEEEKTKPQVTKQVDGVSQPMAADQAALALVKGLAKGQFAITNEPLLEVLRTLANGVAPRGNRPLEMLLLPLFMLVEFGYLLYIDWVVQRAAKQTKSTKSDPKRD